MKFSSFAIAVLASCAMAVPIDPAVDQAPSPSESEAPTTSPTPSDFQYKYSVLQEKMDTLGQELDSEFSVANDNASTSVNQFFTNIRDSFNMLGQMSNETAKEELNQNWKSYNNVTKDATTRYFDSIITSITGAFKSFQESAQAVNDGSNATAQPIAGYLSSESAGDNATLTITEEPKQANVSYKFQVFNEKMRQLGLELEAQFEKANAGATNSTKMWADNMGDSFTFMKNTTNNTAQNELNQNWENYSSVTEQSAQDYLNGIFDSIVKTFENFVGAMKTTEPTSQPDATTPSAALSEPQSYSYVPPEQQARENGTHVQVSVERPRSTLSASVDMAQATTPSEKDTRITLPPCDTEECFSSAASSSVPALSMGALAVVIVYSMTI